MISKTILVFDPSEFYFNRVYALENFVKESFIESLLANYGPIKKINNNEIARLNLHA